MPDDLERQGQAEAFWRNAQPLDAGRVIFENLPIDVRPRWAVQILELSLRRSRINFAPIEQLRHVARIPSNWPQAHRVFTSMRAATIKLEDLRRRSGSQELLLRQLYLAENVAKVIYNSTNPPDEFDEDSGWWVVVCLKSLVDFWKDGEFSIAAWTAVCSRSC